MMAMPDRTLVRLLIYTLASASSLLIVGMSPLIAGGASAINGIWSLWCVMAPASILDWAIHSSGFGASLLGLLAVLSALRMASRERAVATELCSAARAARLRSIPCNVAATADAVGVVDTLDIVEAPLPFAFVYGWLKPRICVSTGMIERLTERELEAVLFHERWHLVRRDPIRLFVVRTIAAAFAFVPAIQRLAHQFRLSSEIAADHHAVATMGSQRWLAGALAKLVNSEAHSVGVSFLGLAEARIAALSGEFPSEQRGIGRLAMVLLLGATALVLMFLMRGGLGLLTSIWIHHVC